MAGVEIPASLQRYLERVLVAPPPEVPEVELHQRGEIRLREDGDWMPFSAEQRMSATRVEFVWHARVKMAPFVTGVVEDAFEDGHGRLDAKIWGLVPVAHARGLEVDRGEMQRYLAELPWNPLALLHNDALRFGAAEDGDVRVWCADPRTYVDLRLDDAGDIVGCFTRTRVKDETRCHPWQGTFDSYEEREGVRVPARGEVSWLLPSGRFSYFRATIEGLRWARPSV